MRFEQDIKALEAAQMAGDFTIETSRALASRRLGLEVINNRIAGVFTQDMYSHEIEIHVSNSVAR